MSLIPHLSTDRLLFAFIPSCLQNHQYFLGLTWILCFTFLLSSPVCSLSFKYLPPSSFFFPFLFISPLTKFFPVLSSVCSVNLIFQPVRLDGEKEFFVCLFLIFSASAWPTSHSFFFLFFPPHFCHLFLPACCGLLCPVYLCHVFVPPCDSPSPCSTLWSRLILIHTA